MTKTRRYRVLKPEQKTAIETSVKMMLHASRDCYRNQLRDTTKITWVVSDGYYGEAFGILRGLEVLGYGFFGADNVDEPHNLKWWFNQLADEVLTEEGYYSGEHTCDYCLERHGKDSKRQHGFGYEKR